MLTLASTNRFVAGPLPPGPAGFVRSAVFVSRVTVAVAGLAPASPSAKLQTAVAFAVKIPAVLLLIVTVHERVLPVSVGVHVVAESGADDRLTDNDVSVPAVPDWIPVVDNVNVCE